MATSAKSVDSRRSSESERVHPSVADGADTVPTTPPDLEPDETPAIAPKSAAESATDPVTPVVELAPGLVVDGTAREVRFSAFVCLREGWLEQLVCTPGTREHESIFVTAVTPSLIHAALLLLGLEPGTPGSWRLEDDRVVAVAPTGPPLEVFVRFAPIAAADAADLVPIASLVHDTGTERSPDVSHFLFAGSLIDDREGLPPGIPRYVADRSGSVIGLVTFGDELIALPKVRPDQVDVAPAEWMAWTERIPPLETEVTVVLRAVR